MLSPQQYLYITSQERGLPQNWNKSENLKRIKETLDKIHTTFEILLTSRNLKQSYVNELFPAYKLDEFLGNLVMWNPQNKIEDENNKLEITRLMIRIGFSYFQQRFEDSALYSEKIKEANDLLEDLTKIADTQIEKEEKYHMPPKMEGSRLVVHGLCMSCYSPGSGYDKKQAVKNIRHKENCPYDKKDPDRFIHIIPKKK